MPMQIRLIPSHPFIQEKYWESLENVFVFRRWNGELFQCTVVQISFCCCFCFLCGPALLHSQAQTRLSAFGEHFLLHSGYIGFYATSFSERDKRRWTLVRPKGRKEGQDMQDVSLAGHTYHTSYVEKYVVWFGLFRFMSSLMAVFSQTAGSKKGLFSILVSRVLAWQRPAVLAWHIFATWSTS